MTDAQTHPDGGGPDFLSDNSAGLCPEAVEALLAQQGGRETAYSDDRATADAVAAIRDVLEADAEVFFVATGTAANTLGIAALVQPWQRVLCEQWAHFAVDESTGPELLANCRVTTIPNDGRKLTPAILLDADRSLERGVHHPMPGAVTISNPTEHGEVYTPDEVAALADAAHARGYRLHLDGARFANAVAALGCTPRDLTVGVDALSFGGAKNGLALGEAVVFLPGPAQHEAAARFPHLRKAAGHLVAKNRYLAAPFAAVLRDDVWLRHAGHANAMASRLAAGLARAGVTPRFAVEANLVFAPLTDGLDRHLTDRGWRYHMPGHPDWRVARFVTAFDTPPERVDRLVADVQTRGYS